MPYAELVHALEAEVARQIHEAGAAAQAERDRLLDATRAQAAVDLELALQAQRERAAVSRAHSVARARLERERLLLVEKRRLLDELKIHAVARLRTRGASYLARLTDEALADFSEPPTELVVDPVHVEPLRRHLEAHHPELSKVASIREMASTSGGVEVRSPRFSHDNTWAARLERAWPEIEGAVATLLFGGGDGPV